MAVDPTPSLTVGTVACSFPTRSLMLEYPCSRILQLHRVANRIFWLVQCISVSFMRRLMVFTIACVEEINDTDHLNERCCLFKGKLP
jgi:hypothetical protein